MTGFDCAIFMLIMGGTDGKTQVYGSFGKVILVLKEEVDSSEMETNFMGALRLAHFFFLPHLIWCFNKALNRKPALRGTLMALIGFFMPYENLSNPLFGLNFILAIIWNFGGRTSTFLFKYAASFSVCTTSNWYEM